MLEPSPRRWRPRLVVLALTLPSLALAQGRPARPDSLTTDALASWIALQASPGRERGATDVITRALPAWRRDEIGNLVLRRGSGRPRRVVACGLDQAGYAVSEITDDGYLRLHGAGNQRRSPLWDQFHKGQRILVHTRRAPLPGVIAVRSTHLWRGRQGAEAPVTIEELWVDIGARSSADAAALGVSLLDPVSREWPRWVYGDIVAGPAAAERAGCAAVAAAAREAPAVGETIYVISAQSTFGWSGLSAAVARLGEVDTLVVASARFGGTESVQSSGAVLRRVIRAPFKPIPALRLGTTIALAVRSSFGGTLAESVRAADMAEYATAVARVSGITGAAGSALPVPPLPGAAPRPAQAAQRDSLTPAAALLTTLTDTYGVSGNEGAVREAIRAALPTWAQSRAQIDTAGNLIVALGPERDTVVFMAHMDEIGFAITGIARDGKVSLRRLGGFFPFLWEGQPALLHLERDGAHTMLPGVFVPRDSGNTREPRELTAWFGLDSAALVARGAAIGSTLTGYKSATRLASTRFTNRSIDDRAGCTALILALRAIDPEKLGRKVIFVWSVREEIGLEGAAAMANSLGAPIRRVHAVDTFVSSDSPLESRRFAYAPIGRGAVVRALDNSSATPPSQVDSVVAVARRAGIPLQVGTTNGGNDGSEFVRYGTPDVPIAWPLRYSHSPAELIDLADVAALGRLVAALAMQ